MRLNPFNPGSISVGGGGGGGLPGGRGGLGCGAIVIALVGAVVFGIDPGTMLGGMDAMQGTNSAPATTSQGGTELCYDNPYATETCNALGSLNETWEPVFAQAGIAFQQPNLWFIKGGAVRTGCGQATSAAGPFYCPADQTIYIDTGFYQQLEQQLGAGGDFARYYVVAHEYGHHIQTLTGVAGAIRSAQSQAPHRSNQLQVLMELQADCYAGAWAGRNRNLIEPGDLEEGMTAAAAIGDDALMRGSGRPVNSESFTHGTSEQRMQALRLGLETGDDTQCDRIVELGG